MLPFIFTALVATVTPALATFANVAMIDSSLTSRDDPCSRWCNPWFEITDAEVACKFLSDKSSSFQTCAGCSVAHGGSIDEWAADYYNGDYAYYTDCPACYGINVAGVDFSSVSTLYNSVINPSPSVAASTSTKAAVITSSVTGTVKAVSASGSAAVASKPTTASQAFDNTGMKNSGASQVKSTAFATLLFSLAFACFVF